MIKNTMITLVPSKLNALPTEEILLQQIFSVIQQNTDGEILLKKDHDYGYYTKVQMAMGLLQVNYCGLSYSPLNA